MTATVEVPMFDTHAPGLFVVRYARSEDMQPERQAELVEALRAAAGAGRVGIVFDVAPEVRWVDASVPTFWLRATGDASLRIRAMAIVTQSAAVQIATSGFAAAVGFRGAPLQVRTFRATGPALEWVGEALATATAVPAAG